MEETEVIESQASARPEWGKVPVATILRYALFATFALGVLGGAHVYIASRLIAGLSLTGGVAAGAWLLTATLFGSLFLAFAARKLPMAIARVFHAIGYTWMGLFALSLFAVAAVDLVSALASVVTHAPRWGLAEVAVVFALVVPSGVWGAVRALGKAKVERIDVPIANLPEELEGYRIVQLSDLHVGDTVGRRWTQRLVDQVNELSPDAIALTGDMADGTAAKVHDEIAPLGGLKARDGVYFCTGNHEYFNGLGGWLAEMRRLGFHVLLNEHKVVHRGKARLVIAGVTDHDGGSFVEGHASRPDLAFEGAPREAPRVLLAHQPRTAFQAGGLGIDLQLSGHTHGGQFFPWKYFVRLQQPVLAGMADVGGVRVYTHRGTGFWGPPLRLMAPPEIAELRLTRA
ncbi:MAG: metallophosphoesterase [Myxococcales bacterium]